MGDEDKPKSKRIFINNVDAYQAKNIGKYLSQVIPGASLEEGEDEAEEADQDMDGMPTPKEGCFEIIATMKDKNNPKPDFVKEILQYDTKEELYEHIVECDAIVFDITEDPEQIDKAVWTISEMNADILRIDKQKIFILISTVMTWAKSKPLDPEDPDIPFTEDDYRRRKPHPNFKEHINAEKAIMKLGKGGKGKLQIYVVAAGLTYGAGESIFHYMFKSAWLNAEYLQAFGNGQNVLPTIHIRDLAGVVQNIIDAKPKVKYLIATDDSNHTLEEIVKVVSLQLGSGKIKYITKEEALLSKDIDQADFDMLLANLRMDAIHVRENMRIRWVAEQGMVENIDVIVREFKEMRNLQPLRVLVVGPPGVGKSTVVRQLCSYYKLHHVHLKDVLADALDALQRRVARAEAGPDQDLPEGEAEEEEDEARVQEDAELMEQVNESREENNGRLTDALVVRFVKEKLHSKPCQNQGFVLDGFPKAMDTATDTFAAEDEDEGDDEVKTSYDRTIMPINIVSLEASDDMLRQRIMNLPESSVAGTHNTEQDFSRRLADYHANNSEDDSVLHYFDELEFHPERIDITEDKSDNMMETVEKIKKIVGEPRNYGMTTEEREEENRKQEEIQVQKEVEEKTEREEAEALEAAERKQKQEEWIARLEEVQREEQDLLETQSVPLRNYLMKHVMPTLTKGLINCCKVRPDDAIDYLAEYLFKHNPQVD